MAQKISAGNRFKLTLKGEVADSENVRLSDLIDQLKAVKDVLNSLDKRVAGASKPTLYYRVVGLSMNSPATIEVEAVAQQGKHDFSSVIVKDFINGLKLISSGNRPEGADYDILASFRNIATPLKRHLSSLRLEGAGESVEVSRDIEQRVDVILGPDQIEIGSIRGSLELIDIHNNNNLFRIYPVLGAETIKCHFPSSLLPDAIQGLNHFVKVHGELHIKSKEKFPHYIEVDSIEILPEQHDIPSLRSLRGFAKGAYSGKSSVEHINGMRDDW
jgi:hypothetical protein